MRPALIYLSWLAAQANLFTEHRARTPFEHPRGAAEYRDAIVSWGTHLVSRDLPAGRTATLATARYRTFAKGGCQVAIAGSGTGIAVQDGVKPGTLAWFEAP